MVGEENLAEDLSRNQPPAIEARPEESRAREEATDFKKKMVSDFYAKTQITGFEKKIQTANRISNIIDRAGVLAGRHYVTFSDLKEVMIKPENFIMGTTALEGMEENLKSTESFAEAGGRAYDFVKKIYQEINAPMNTNKVSGEIDVRGLGMEQWNDLFENSVKPYLAAQKIDKIPTKNILNLIKLYKQKEVFDPEKDVAEAFTEKEKPKTPLFERDIFGKKATKDVFSDDGGRHLIVGRGQEITAEIIREARRTSDALYDLYKSAEEEEE